MVLPGRVYRKSVFFLNQIKSNRIARLPLMQFFDFLHKIESNKKLICPLQVPCSLHDPQMAQFEDVAQYGVRKQKTKMCFLFYFNLIFCI